MDKELEIAQKEIHKSLSLTNFCTCRVSISFIDELPRTLWGKTKAYGWFSLSALALALLVVAEYTYVTSLLIGSTSVAEFVASLHIIGYGCICYMFWNIFGVCLYTVPPVIVYIYGTISGVPADLGYVWHAKYPFDKTLPVYHEIVYVFETFAGVSAVWPMIGTDMLFTSMASHISMLLRILQVKIRNLVSNTALNHNMESMDCYEDILAVIKIHQRLISYSKELEDAFTVVNLINVLMSSVNICCVVFNIVLLEPWTELGNKFFLGAVMTQVGILCWYADDIYRTSMGVSDAVYESGWYKSNARCRRALLLLLLRSQKPLCFTALKFRNITMATYSSILTTSYSYFALLYTMYRE